MKIKTYPLQFTEEYLKEIESVAKDNGMNIKQFMFKAIEKFMEQCLEKKGKKNLIP